MAARAAGIRRAFDWDPERPRGEVAIPSAMFRGKPVPLLEKHGVTLTSHSWVTLMAVAIRSAFVRFKARTVTKPMPDDHAGLAAQLIYIWGISLAYVSNKNGAAPGVTPSPSAARQHGPG